MPAPQVWSSSAESGRRLKTFIAGNRGSERRGRRGRAMGISEERVVAVDWRDRRLMLSRMISANGDLENSVHDRCGDNIFRGRRVRGRRQAGRRLSSVDAGERPTARRNGVAKRTAKRR